MADVINKIQTQILGEEEVRRLTKEIAECERQFLSLANAMKAVGASEAQVKMATAGIAAQIGGLNAQLKAAGGASYLGKRGALEFAQAFQDFDAAGIRGITNQVDRLTMALGGGAGLAAAAVVTAIAFQKVGENWPDVKKWFTELKALEGLKGTGFAAVAERVGEAVFGAPTEAAKEEEATAKFGESLKGAVGSAAEARGKTFAQDVGLFDPEKGLAGVREELTKAIINSVAKGGGPILDWDQAMKIATADLEKAVKGDPGAEASIRALLPDLGKKREATEERDAERKIEQIDKDIVDRNERIAKAADRKLIRELEAQGEENEKAGKESLKIDREADEAKRRNDIRELEGRKTWLKTMGKEQRAPQIFDSMQSYLASIQTAKGKDPQLEQVIQKLDEQIVILKESAGVGA